MPTLEVTTDGYGNTEFRVVASATCPCGATVQLKSRFAPFFKVGAQGTIPSMPATHRSDGTDALCPYCGTWRVRIQLSNQSTTSSGSPAAYGESTLQYGLDSGSYLWFQKSVPCVSGCTGCNKRYMMFRVTGVVWTEGSLSSIPWPTEPTYSTQLCPGGCSTGLRAAIHRVSGAGGPYAVEASWTAPPPPPGGGGGGGGGPE